MSEFLSEQDVAKYLDQKFGKGKWRFTSGYRSQESEDALRDSGAGTVAPGHTSAHSKGDFEAPGAEDIVVDGMSADEVGSALKGGPFAKVFPEGKHGPEGAHVHIEPIPPPPEGFSLDAGGSDKPPPPPPGFKLDAPSGVGAEASVAHPRRPTPLEQARDFAAQAPGGIAKGLGEDIMARVRPSAATLAADIAPPPPVNGLKAAVTQGVNAGLGPMKQAGDLLGYASAPVMGAIDYGLGRPAEALTGVPRQTAGDIASLALPALGEIAGDAALAGRARGAGVGMEALRGAEASRITTPGVNALASVSRGGDREHAAAVARLEAAGVRPAAHQRAGGGIQRFTDAAKSDFHVGSGIRASERQADDSFNRALYNKALGPLGESVPDNAPIGRPGIRNLQQRFSAAYQEAAPHIHVPDDPTLTGDLAGIRTSVAKRGAPQEQQFEAILNQDVLHHFGPNGLDGETYQSVKSDLLRQSRELRSSGDPNARGLSHALNDVADALSAAATRGSDPKWRARIGDIDEGYAMLTRIEDAAARRQGGRGEITPQDLLAAAKKGDSRIRKRGFAGGDALLQDFGEDADRVLSPQVRDSGTSERQIATTALGMAHGLGGAVAGHALGIGELAGAALDVASAPVTNSLARALLQRGPPRPPVRALPGPNRAMLGGAGAVPAISNQAQQ